MCVCVRVCEKVWLHHMYVCVCGCVCVRARVRLCVRAWRCASKAASDVCVCTCV